MALDEADWTLLDDIRQVLVRIAEALERENEIKDDAVKSVTASLDEHLAARNNPVSHLKPMPVDIPGENTEPSLDA